MSEYNEMTDEQKADVTWVIDTDGWCYYTKALTAVDTGDSSKTTHLLENVSLNEEAFKEAFGAPYSLDYYVNVRLQAISADLEDYGAKDNAAQWSNEDYINDSGETVGVGRVISATSNPYEITTDSDITPEAENLILSIKNTYNNPYANADGSIAVAVSTYQELYDAFMNPDIHSILVTDDIEVEQYTKNSLDSERLEAYGFTTGSYTYTGDKMIDLGHHTITKNGSGQALFQAHSGATVVLKHGTVNVAKTSFADVSSSNVDGEYYPAYLECVDINATANASGGYAMRATLNCDIKLYNSTITNLGASTSSQAIKMSNNANLYMNGSKLICENGGGISHLVVNRNHDANITMENSSILCSQYGILLDLDDVLNVTDSEITGSVAITENHDRCPKEINLTNTTLTATHLGVFKVADHPMTMKDCTVNINTGSGIRGQGLFLRSGDITLDNVNVTVNQGSGMDTLLTDDYLKHTVYDNENSGYGYENYEAMRIVANSYESINLNIIGGSYVTNFKDADGKAAESVFIYADGYTIKDSTYVYSNEFTLSDNPTFSPATNAFDGTYTNTTINIK